MRAPPRFPLPFAAHRSFRTPPDPGITSPGIGLANQIKRHRLNPIHPISFVASALNFGSCRTVVSGALSTTELYRIAVWAFGAFRTSGLRYNH